MSTVPRRRQKQIFIRSDLAAQLLTELAKDGLTKVSILEDALARAASELPESDDDGSR
jgi:hypothetical protein